MILLFISWLLSAYKKWVNATLYAASLLLEIIGVQTKATYRLFVKIFYPFNFNKIDLLNLFYTHFTQGLIITTKLNNLFIINKECS